MESEPNASSAAAEVTDLMASAAIVEESVWT